MLLTKKQYQHLHITFNKVAGDIRDLQDSAKDKYDKDEDKTSYAKGLMIGNRSALEDCYNLLRREADVSYQKETVAADTQLDDSLTYLEDHMKAIKYIVSNIKNSIDSEPLKSDFDNFNNITAVMEAIIKGAKLVVRQTES